MRVSEITWLHYEHTIKILPIIQSFLVLTKTIPITANESAFVIAWFYYVSVVLYHLPLSKQVSTAGVCIISNKAFWARGTLVYDVGRSPELSRQPLACYLRGLPHTATMYIKEACTLYSTVLSVQRTN